MIGLASVALCPFGSWLLLRSFCFRCWLGRMPHRYNESGLPFVARRTELRVVTARPFFAMAFFFAKATKNKPKGILRSGERRSGGEGR